MNRNYTVPAPLGGCVVGGGGAALKDCAVAERHSDVTSGYSNAGDGLNRLRDEIKQLHERLEPVLLPSGPSKPETATPEPVRSPLGDALHTHARELHALADTLREIRQRTQL